jgi:transcriptional antiterminator RfaH
MRRTLLSLVKLWQYETPGLKEAALADSGNRIRELAFKSRPRWYLVQCRARQDGRALEHLERQGFECYRPLYEKERVRRGRKQLTSSALFPGYLFIRLDRIHDNWLPICSTRGVIQIVRFNGYPLPVADAVVGQIRQRIESGPLREPYLKTGEHVVITEGSFSGIEAMFMASDGDERVMLLLNILQSEQVLSFPIESVRKVRETASATESSSRSRSLTGHC